MMKTMKYLSMAALALVGAIVTSCSSDDNFIDTPQQPENKSNVVTMTTTVGLDEGAEARGTSRALNIDYVNKQAVKTFAAGETMAIVYKNTSGNTVKAVSAALTDGDITTTADPATDKKSATFTFELTDPDKTQAVTYIYPAAMAKDDGSVNYDALSTQDGTLDNLATNLDLATYTDTWDGTSLPTGTLANQLAILAMTLKNSDGSSDITSSITSLTLSDGTNNYTVTRSAAAGPIYLAILPTDNASIKITAASATNDYSKSLTSKTYAASNGYNVSWKMTPFIMNTTDGVAVEKSDDGKYTLQDGKEYTISGTGSGQIIGNAATMTFADGTVFNGYISTLTYYNSVDFYRATIKLDGNVTVNGDIRASYSSSYHTLITTAGGTHTLTVNGSIDGSCWMLTKDVTLYTSSAPTFAYGFVHDASGLNITSTDEEIGGVAYKKFVGAGGPNESYITVWLPEDWGTSDFYVQFYKDENTTVGSTVSLTSVGTTFYGEWYNAFTANIPSEATKYKVLENRLFNMMPVINDFANISGGTLRINNDNGWGYIY